MSGSLCSLFSPASPNKRSLGQIRHRFRQFRNQPSDALKFNIPLSLATWAARAWMWARERDNGLYLLVGFLNSLNHLSTASSSSGYRDSFTNLFFESKHTLSSIHFAMFSLLTLIWCILDLETSAFFSSLFPQESPFLPSTVSLPVLPRTALFVFVFLEPNHTSIIRIITIP